MVRVGARNSASGQYSHVGTAMGIGGRLRRKKAKKSKVKKVGRPRKVGRPKKR